MHVDPYEAVSAREIAARQQAQLTFQENEAEKRVAITEVYEAASKAVRRLGDLTAPWPDGKTTRFENRRLVVTHIGMKQPLFLGSDGEIYRKVGSGLDPFDPEFIKAPLHRRKKASDIRHIIKFLDKLGR